MDSNPEISSIPVQGAQFLVCRFFMSDFTLYGNLNFFDWKEQTKRKIFLQVSVVRATRYCWPASIVSYVWSVHSIHISRHTLFEARMKIPKSVNTRIITNRPGTRMFLTMER